MKDFTVELTKREKLLEVNNDMCHNFYYLQYGRINNADQTKFRRFKFVFWFDIFDVMEYFEKDVVSKQEINEFANEIAWCMSETAKGGIKSFDDCQAFYDWCNETINDYNK
jgi:hypothetical protein